LKSGFGFVSESACPPHCAIKAGGLPSAVICMPFGQIMEKSILAFVRALTPKALHITGRGIAPT
jgi:hypothetical protein